MKKFLLSSLFLGFSASGIPPGKTGREESKDQVSKASRAESVSGPADLAGMKTPERPTLSADEPTPGQKIAIEQMGVNKTEFDEAFGSELVDSWNIDWDCFKEQLPFDHPRRRNNLKKIENYLKQIKSNYDLRNKITDLIVSTQKIYSVHLEETCKAEIRKLRSDIAASPKLGKKYNGVQLGCKINLQLEDGSILKYHVKTHSGGRLMDTSKSTAAKTVNPIELFVYKILEHLGIGCECHFFGYSKEDFYIATLDAGTNGEFHEFEHFQKNKEEGTKLWGEKLDEIEQFEYKTEFGTTSYHREEAEEFIKDDNLAHDFMFELTKVDYVCRMLFLGDVLNNSDNFGFIEKDGKREVKIIDFRLGDKNKWEIDLNNPLSEEDIENNLIDIFRGFKTGNGQYRYASMEPPRAFSLHYRDIPLRFEIMKQTFDFYFDILEKVDFAYQDICKTINQTMFKEEKKLCKKN